LYSADTHIVVVGHEIGPPLPDGTAATLAVTQVGVADVGLARVTAFPSESTATQPAIEAHETPDMGSAPSTLNVRQVGDDAVGSVETIASPALSTATHKDVVGQDTALKYGPWAAVSTLESISCGVQVGVLAVGSVEIRADAGAWGPVAVAMHNEVD
jgi:hypothetical protein